MPNNVIRPYSVWQWQILKRRGKGGAENVVDGGYALSPNEVGFFHGKKRIAKTRDFECWRNCHSHTASMAISGKGGGGKPDEIVSFPEWREELSGASALSVGVKAAYERAILGLLRACKSTGRPLSAGFIRWHLARTGLTEEERQAERTGLAWLFKAARAAGKTRPAERAFAPPTVAEVAGSERARSAGSVARKPVPPRAADDQGGADWERDLIAAIRRKGFLWRTEQTYRAWAARFVKFLAPRSPQAAGGAEVAAFLSALAVCAIQRSRSCE